MVLKNTVILDKGVTCQFDGFASSNIHLLNPKATTSGFLVDFVKAVKNGLSARVASGKAAKSVPCLANMVDMEHDAHLVNALITAFYGGPSVLELLDIPCQDRLEHLRRRLNPKSKLSFLGWVKFKPCDIVKTQQTLVDTRETEQLWDFDALVVLDSLDENWRSVFPSPQLSQAKLHRENYGKAVDDS